MDLRPLARNKNADWIRSIKRAMSGALLETSDLESPFSYRGRMSDINIKRYLGVCNFS